MNFFFQFEVFAGNESKMKSKFKMKVTNVHTLLREAVKLLRKHTYCKIKCILTILYWFTVHVPNTPSISAF